MSQFLVKLSIALRFIISMNISTYTYISNIRILVTGGKLTTYDKVEVFDTKV